MPRYHFDVRDGETLMEDFDGQILPDLTAARHVARVAAVESIYDNLLCGITTDSRQFQVRDDLGRVVFTMPFVDALTLPEPRAIPRIAKP